VAEESFADPESMLPSLSPKENTTDRNESEDSTHA
jgi:hypothetical protein